MDDVLLIWDAIFSSISKDSLKMLTDSSYNPLSQNDYTNMKKDPLEFMEFMSLAMIEYIRTPCNFALANYSIRSR